MLTKSDQGRLPDARDACATTVALLAARAANATICPSEVARDLAKAGGDWRGQMAAVHDAVDELVADGLIRLSWKGATMTERNGPYRIGRP